VSGGAGTAAVTRAEREQYERDGYLILDDVGCPEDVFDRIVEDLADRYTDQGQYTEDGVLYARRRIMDAWKINEDVKRLALAPKPAAILQELYGRKPLPFQTLNFRVGTQQAPHSDAIHFSSIPPGFMCGVWIALEDMDEHNGPLEYYPGSHKLPELSMADVGAAPTKADYDRYEEHIAELIERERLEPHYATISKGQALIWAANLLHGGSPQKDKSRSRHSQVTHFFFEGCKYYTPLLSGDDEIHWREPEWIQ
jgi:ectoine hydroxylase-related dioxygenase (phytanoyl-CoA dioxygenase family)